MSFPDTLAIILAAGSSVRFGEDKLSRVIGSRPVIFHTLLPFLELGLETIVVVPKDQPFQAKEQLLAYDHVHVFAGGDTRHQSLKRALEGWSSFERKEKPRYVLIHDGARPCVGFGLIRRVLSSLEEMPSGAVVPVLSSHDTVYQVTENNLKTIPRESLLHAQTPQGFHYDELLSLVDGGNDYHYTDEVSLYLSQGKSVRTIVGEFDNVKITHPEDEDRVARFFARHATTKSGFGFDVHRLTQGRGMVLGGHLIVCEYALDGHSDADVVLHALADGIYGMIGDGDIGIHFPPSDDRWKGEVSTTFLQHALSRLSGSGGSLIHVDVTIVAEYPKISPHRELICSSLAKLCSLSLKNIGLKATTTEGLGFTGRGEGIAAFVNVTASFERLRAR